jgi:hypothetical protein
MENETKAWWQSAGIWGSLVVVLSAGAGLVGYTIAPEDQAHLVTAATKTAELATQATALVGGLVALFGRVRATKRIG